MKPKTLRTRAAVLLSGLALLGLASSAGAGQGIYDPLSTCAANNCQSVMLFGTYDVDSEGNADCFQAQLYTAGNECVRIHVLQQGTDLAMVFACPNGWVWGDDDSGGAMRPLIKAEPWTAGWCTLQVCHWAGSGTRADFRLRYGRYNLGNRNCGNPTALLIADPFSSSSLESGKEKEQ